MMIDDNGNDEAGVNNDTTNLQCLRRHKDASRNKPVTDKSHTSS